MFGFFIFKVRWNNLCTIDIRSIIKHNTMKSCLPTVQNCNLTFSSITQFGYTMVELMIVVGIIGILSAIAIPSYYKYTADSHKSACISEVKGYSNYVFTIVNDQEDESVTIAPSISSCDSITDATGWTLDTQQKIVAVAKAPSNARIECDIPNGSPCIVLP